MFDILGAGNIAVFIALGVAIATSIYLLIQMLGFRRRSGIEQEKFETIMKQLQPSEPREAAELELLKNFYLVTLRRATISFWFSLLFSAIGFLVIIVTVLQIPIGEVAAQSQVQEDNPPLDVWSKLLNVIAGTIITATSALIYSISNRSQANANSAFVRVRADNETSKMIAQIGEIESKEERDQIRSLMVRKKLGLQQLPEGNG